MERVFTQKGEGNKKGLSVWTEMLKRTMCVWVCVCDFWAPKYFCGSLFMPVQILTPHVVSPHALFVVYQWKFMTSHLTVPIWLTLLYNGKIMKTIMPIRAPRNDLICSTKRVQWLNLFLSKICLNFCVKILLWCLSCFNVFVIYQTSKMVT